MAAAQPECRAEAQIEAKGLYTEPTHHFMIFDEDEDDSEVEPVAPNFDLETNARHFAELFVPQHIISNQQISLRHFTKFTANDLIIKRINLHQYSQAICEFP